jgi:hypothetical protein
VIHNSRVVQRGVEASTRKIPVAGGFSVDACCSTL